MLIFIYVISITIWSRGKIKKIEKNLEGKFGGALEQDVKIQEKKTQNLLLGFTPGEALNILVSTTAAIAAIIGLFLQLRI